MTAPKPTCKKCRKWWHSREHNWRVNKLRPLDYGYYKCDKCGTTYKCSRRSR